MTLDALQIATYVAWEEYYAQLTKQVKYIKGRGSGPWGHKYEKDFNRIAKRCAKRAVDVRSYIETAIELLRAENRTYIIPKDLTKNEMLDAVKRVLESRCSMTDPAEYWLDSIREVQRMTRIMPMMYPEMKTALMVPSTGFDAWFRVMLLQPFDDELFKAYGNVAHAELGQSRKLRTFLRQQVPDNMTELERRIASFGDA